MLVLAGCGLCSTSRFPMKRKKEKVISQMKLQLSNEISNEMSKEMPPTWLLSAEEVSFQSVVGVVEAKSGSLLVF